jgi:hypothetical protein
MSNAMPQSPQLTDENELETSNPIPQRLDMIAHANKPEIANPILQRVQLTA